MSYKNKRYKPSVGGLSSCNTNSLFDEVNCDDINYPHDIDNSWLPEIFPEKQTLSFIQVQSARIIQKIYIKNQPHYLVSAQSAPRSDFSGRILIYKIDKNGALELKRYLDSGNFLEGRKIGENFGASIAVGDFNGDGLDDFVVGATGWTKYSNGNFKASLGRIYIFHQNEFGDFDAATSIEGKSEFGEFGKSIVANDLNLDGFSDLVIGAPSENLVYIHYSDQNGIKIEPAQIISPQNFAVESNFGYKLELKTDIDDNDYPDLVISSTKSNQVFVYRTRPSLTANIQTEIYRTPIQPDDKEVTVESCIDFSGRGIPKKLKGLVKINVDATRQLLTPRNVKAGSTEQVFGPSRTVYRVQNKCSKIVEPYERIQSNIKYKKLQMESVQDLFLMSMLL